MRTTRIRVFLAVGLGAVLLAGPWGAAAAADDGGRTLLAEMTGAQEAPGPGDPDGSGTAVLRVNPGQEQICYTLTVENVEDVTAAHIHVAPPGEPGPVVVPLVPPTTGSSSDCASVDRDLALAILKDPAAYYVNVHSSDFGAGAVRGQLHT
ncbi:MAG: CHRD domain-containing protein [Micromonosporaceae bacterium]|nr:CHRD domain-containing protein [Micromonosporaceae bacterium]